MDSRLATRVYSILPERGGWVAVSLASALIYYTVTTYLSWRRLRHFPGPPLASVSNLWSLFMIAGGQTDINIAKAQKKYGKAVRIGPDAIMVYDPETVWHMNSARSTYARGDWYLSMRYHPEGDSVLSELSTVLHDRRKANLTSGFAGRGLVNLEADVDSQIAALVKLFRNKVANGQGNRLDFSKIIRWFQLDLITLAGLGEAWGDMADETDHFTFLETMDSAVPLVHTICFVPFLRNIVFSKLFLYLFGPRVTDKEGMGRSIREMRAIVKSHFEDTAKTKSGRQHGDMLDEWIKHGQSAEQCEWDLAIMMPAGTETSVTALRGTLLHILSSPAVYHKLKQEIAEGIKAGRISKPITNEQAKAMPYLQAVISEGMRIVPPIINGLGRRVPAGGDMICGKFVPEGTDIYMNCVSMMMDTEVFGADAEVFRPERFLECDEKRKAYMLKTIDLLFGHGRWLCLGRPLALIELNKVLVELLRVFDFQISNPEQPWKRKVYSTSIIDDFNLRVWENPLD